MSDFSIQVGGDFSELLRGFQQLESRAQQAGQTVGKGLAEGIQGFSSKSVAALNAELSRLQQRQLKVAVDSSAFEKTGQKIEQIKALLSEVERRRLTLGVDDRSITALQAKLGQLQNQQLKLDVDSQEFADAQRQVNALEKELQDISSKKVLLNADPSSILALRTKLGDLQGELQRVAIGSQRFQELTEAVRQTERELAKAGESTDKFRILDGVVQGIAFSLSNVVVEGAQRAIAAMGGLVAEFGRLDTELRQAAAAAGEPGGYDKLARSVEQVGIEAAGTTLQVAQLATELVRGGMTVEQANASLGAIVRGAEATGTSFANMGSVVSASLKGFGLEAKDANRVVDALVQGANASAASVDGMGMAFKYAAPVAKILGVTVEDLGVAIGLLTNAGIDASEAGVTLRNGLSKLASAAPKSGGAMQDLTGQSAMAAKAMQALGVEIYNANGTLRPMEEVLLKLKGAFEKLDPSSKIRLAANLFGGEDDGAKWLALLNQSEVEIKKMATAMANTKGATDTARDAIQGFEMKLKALYGSLGAISNTIGSVAAAALIPFVDAANLIVGAIVALPGPVKTLTAAVGLLTGAYVAATVAQIAFTKAVATDMVQDAIASVRLLAGELRGRLVADIARARAAWAGLQAAFTTTSSNAAVAGLAQMAQGLRNLNAAQAAAGFKQLALAIQATAAQGKAALVDLTARGVMTMRAGLVQASAALFDLGVQLKAASAASAAAQKGLTGTTAALQGGMTAGAGGASKAVLGLSAAFNSLGTITAGGALAGMKGMAVAFGAAVVAAGPLLIALAAIVPAIVGYNKIMDGVRKDTDATWQSVERFGKTLEKNGTAFEDLGRKGGPVAEAFTSAKRALESFTDKLKDVPFIGDATKRAMDTLYGAVKKLNDAAIWNWLPKLYAEAEKNQKIIEAGDAIEQFDQQLNATSASAAKFTEKLKAVNQVPAGSIKTYTTELNKNRQQMATAAAEASGLADRYKILAESAKATNQPELVAFYTSVAKAKQADAQIMQERLRQLEEEAVRRGLVVDKLKLQELSVAAVTAQVKQLTAASNETASAIKIGETLQSYGQALADLEQSRFNIAKARGAYELQQGEEALRKQVENAKARGASEAQLDKIKKAGEEGLEAIRQQNRAAEAQALQLRFTALQQEQQLQQAILVLTQEKARADANIELGNARLELLKAEKTLNEENNKIFKDKEKIAVAEAQVVKAREIVTLQQGNLDLLSRLQPLEQLVANAKGQTAQNALIAEGASKGIAVATQSTVQPTQALQAAAAAAGMSFRQAADGSWQLVTAAQNGAAGTREVASAAEGAKTAMEGSAQAASGIGTELDKAGAKAQTAADKTTQVGANAASSVAKTKPLVDALGSAAKNAGVVATANMAGNLTKASGSAGGIRDAMVKAASAAREFLTLLQQASGLPGSRWTGGPVAAGQTVRINDGPAGRSLGQESFLTATGKLSLINRPANSLWTPATSGTVIPAGITESLKARGVFDARRGSPAAAGGIGLAEGGTGQDLAATVARQAVAIGKLQQSVDRLVEKDWNVQVRVRNNAGGASHLNLFNRMR
jgi:TP901 family phage tail tape measure protein